MGMGTGIPQSEHLRILFVHPVTEMSIGDVARGYRNALERQGHLIVDYHLGRRMNYHMQAIPQHVQNAALVSKHASETILNEAIYLDADLVLIVCGLNVHPIALWLLARAKFKVAIVFTESPYEDESQRTWLDLEPSGYPVDLDITVFTNDKFTAETQGWHYLPPAFDPSVHFPAESEPELECDVLMVGTGWPERQRFLESVNWTGIDLRLHGLWPNIEADSPLYPYYRAGIIANNNIRRLYCSARVNINIHRGSTTAKTPGPRVYELAGCGAFQLSDHRDEMTASFGGGVPTFNTPMELESLIHHYLANPDERRTMAARALDAVCDEDFDKRASDLMRIIRSESGRANPTSAQAELVGTTEGEQL